MAARTGEEPNSLLLVEEELCAWPHLPRHQSVPEHESLTRLFKTTRLSSYLC